MKTADQLPREALVAVVNRIIGILYLDDNGVLDPNMEWDAGTIERVAEVLEGYGLAPSESEIADAVEEAEDRGLTEQDLDEPVHDLVQELGLGELNSIEDEDEQEGHISAGERFASRINNGGLERQVAFLLQHNGGLEGVRQLFRQMTKEKNRE
jgi:hypothetical protein